MIDVPNEAVEVGFPADTANMSIARTVAAAVAARADLTIDQIEDVRLAVDEAVAYIITHANHETRIRCRMWVAAGSLHAVVSGPTGATAPPELAPFSLTVLTALVGDVDTDLHDGDLVIHWSLARDHSVNA